jgi:hypothetical protein
MKIRWSPASWVSAMRHRNPGLPAGHRLARHDRIALSELAGEPFVFFLRHRSMLAYDEFIASCRAADFSPAIVQEASGLSALGLLADCEKVPGLVAEVEPKDAGRFWTIWHAGPEPVHGRSARDLCPATVRNIAKQRPARIRTSELGGHGADGFTALSSCSRLMPLTCGYVIRGGIRDGRRPLCVRGRRVSGSERSADRG